MPISITRTDGPNLTATERLLSFSRGNGTMSLDAEDGTFNGVPSRLITNAQVNVDEEDLDKVESYTATGVREELNNLNQSVNKQIVMPVTSEDNTALKTTVQNAGGSYEEVETDNGKHAVIKPTSELSLNTTRDSFKAADALAQNYSEKELTSYLTAMGYDDKQTPNILTQARKVQQARDAGYSDDEIQQYLAGENIEVTEAIDKPKHWTPEADQWAQSSLGKGITDAYYNSQKPNEINQRFAQVQKDKAYSNFVNNEEVSAEELVSGLKVLAPTMVSMTTRTSAFFGNEESARKVETALQQSRAKIITMAAKNGLELQWDDTIGSFTAVNEAGETVPIDDGFWQEFMNSRGEMVGGVSGAIWGARAGAARGPWGAFAGTIIGGAVGSALGSQIDYMQQATKLQEDLEANVMFHKAFTAAETSVIFDTIGFGLFKGGATGIQAIKRVKDFLVDGNTAGAYKALKEVEFITDDQATQLVNQLSKISAGEGGLSKTDNFYEQAIATVAVTKEGSEGIVKAAGALEPRANRAIAKAINDRAKDLLNTVNEASGDNLGRILREDLGNYVANVKQGYQRVVAEAAQSPKASNFRFDYDALAVQPVIDTLEKNIMDPTVLQKFSLQAQRVRDMADGRTFADLLDLRQLVNGFRFNTKISKAKDFDALNRVMATIDTEIKRGAEVVFDKPQEWLDKFSFAKMDYAKMKDVERNAMYKALTKPGIDEETVTKNIARYVGALDGTFEDVVAKLPTQMKTRVENAAVEHFANTFTAGVGEGMRATNFPMLAEKLNSIALTTPKARQMRAAVTELAEVFRNDVPLSQITSNIQIPKFQSYLTADPVVRAKFEIASKLFNYIKTINPLSKEQNTMAMVRVASRVLENPINAKSMKELMQETAGRVNLDESVIQLQQSAARAQAAGRDVSAPRVKLYGDGKILSPSSSSGKEQSIPLHRIATVEDAARVAATEGISPADTRLLDIVLGRYGYKAVQQGTDKVRLLKD